MKRLKLFHFKSNPFFIFFWSDPFRYDLSPQEAQRLLGSYLRNGFAMLRSSPGPRRPPAAGPAAPLPVRCFGSGSLSSRVPVVSMSCSAVCELFRFRIPGNVMNKQMLRGGHRPDEMLQSAGRRPLRCG